MQRPRLQVHFVKGIATQGQALRVTHFYVDALVYVVLRPRIETGVNDLVVNLIDQ